MCLGWTGIRCEDGVFRERDKGDFKINARLNRKSMKPFVKCEGVDEF